ncbi:hypothetical protein [Phytomonospora endophytica]|uniref:Ligase n=1 Tax=Phytomonospora endophytica TaxID=714109 RepID=A0A841FHR4_9ACTN|nr:hypothetical protein [Phytomonospora endophytica]MBB6033388.1 hypothetical protein [Phytomonospora endophytica]GIG70841.1 hypothetical protein Pen01_71360 [Phytomonospora endophytica]
MRAGLGTGTAVPSRALAVTHASTVEGVRSGPRAARLLNLPPAWPLTALLALYPLWWALGLGTLIFPILAVPMLVRLVRLPKVAVPPGFALWLAFCAVVLISLLALDLDPAGTIPGGVASRLPGALFRVVGYASVTICLLYAGNLSERELPRRRLVKLLAWLFAVTVAGGLLGMVAGHFEFTSPLEMMLPAKVAKDGFVQSLVHPAAAQVMDFLGYETPRPAAPWGYTNTWGNNLGILAPFVVVAVWAWPTGRMVRLGAAALLVVALVPAIYSMNRGLWLNLGVAGAYLAFRFLLAGKLWILGAGAALLLAGGILLAATPLGGVVSQRLDNGHSDDGRGYSTEQAVEGVAGSPVIGYGSTRKTIGSGASIAVGATEECPRCGGRVIGGNGQLWQALYAHGILGAACYVGFFLVVLWRFRHDRSAIGLAASAAMLLSLTSMFYYNALVTPLALTMLAYALLWRNKRENHS